MRKIGFRVLAAALAGALFPACENRIEGGVTADITYNVSQQGYKEAVSDTNTIAFAFSDDVTLTKDVVSVTSATGEVTAGELSGSETDDGTLYGPNWFLAITVVKAGSVTVKVSLDGVETGAKTVTVYKADTSVTTPPGPPAVEEDDPVLSAEDTGSKDVGDLGISTTPVVITFNGDDATVTGDEAAGVTAAVSGAEVTITSGVSGVTYVAQGVSDAGYLTIGSSADYALYLNGVVLTSTAGPSFNSTGAGAVSVTVVSGTTNRLFDTSANMTVNGAVYSKGENPLTFTSGGDGILEIRGRGTKKGHGIASKGAVTIAGGDIRVLEALSDGINAPSVTVTGGKFTSHSAGDGIQGDDSVSVTGGELAIVTTGDKAHGLKGDGDTAPVTVGGSASVGIWVYGAGSKCISAGGDATIEGIATLTLETTGASLDDVDKDDNPKWTASSCVKSDANVVIKGGTGTMKATGDGGKCVSADGDVLISGGEFVLNTSGSAFWDDYEADYSGVSCVKADGSITVSGGTITMKSEGGGGKCLSADADIVIDGGNISAVTTGGRLTHGSEDTSAKAIKADGDLTVNGGTIWISTAGSEAEGLESKNVLTINNGLIEIEANDDCVNATSQIVINGGTLFCNSSTNDGIDSNGTITITGGTVVTAGAQGAEEGFDCDNNTFKITGGVLVGLGGNSSTPTSSVCEQRVLICKPSSNATLFDLRSSDGRDVLTMKISDIKSYTQTPCILVSTPEFTNTSYTVYTGGSVSGGTAFHGLTTGGVYTPGTAAVTVTLSSMVTSSGSTTGPGGGGGKQPGRP